MVKRIAFANQKGGVGKSTICTQVAFHLARIDKARVLVVDMDAQGNSSTTLRQEEPLSGTVTNDLYKETLDDVVPMHLACGVDLIGTNKNDRESYETEALPLECAFYPRKHLEKIWDQYDYVLFDCPPSLGRKLLSALLATQYVVCPVKLSGYAVDGLAGLFETLFDVKNTLNPELEILGAIINEYNRSSAHNQALEDVREALGDLVFKNIICSRSPIDTATMKGEPIWKVRNGRQAAQELSAVTKELKKKVNQ